MITVRQGIMLSAIFDKLQVKITNPGANQEQVGADLIMQVVSKAHKAEQEIYLFIANMNKCTTQEAEEVDLIKFIKAMLADSGVRDFLTSASRQIVRGYQNCYPRHMTWVQ